MSNSADKHGGLHLGRRCFLKGAIAAATATLTASTAFSRSSDLRTLKFVHTHTGEHLVATYAKDGCYVPDCLARLNYFLRDFRTGDSHLMDPKLLDVLFDVQVAADRDDEFQVISGYRSPQTNASLRDKSHGVAEHSLHMQGQAIDIRLTGYNTRKLRDLARALQRGGVGYYADSDFVHVDTGRVRYW